MQTGKVGSGVERIAVSILKGRAQPTPVATMVVGVHAGLGTVGASSIARQRYAPSGTIGRWEIVDL